MTAGGNPNTARAARWIGRGVIAVLLVLLPLPLGEFLLYLRWDAGTAAPARPATPPVFQRLRVLYEPFSRQHVHPHYLFFFPFDPAARVALSNEVCTLTPDGYRGPGLEGVGARKLAFLIGGSSAFGHYASHDSTTISAYLNRLQSEYFFVNAGVPSWVTAQELQRLQFQLLAARPSLVVAYNGSNDLANAVLYYRKGRPYAAGTPESFDALQEVVGDIREGRRPRRQSLVRRVFPRLTTFVSRHLGLRLADAPPAYDTFLTDSTPLPDSVIAAAARSYVQNVSMMRDLTRARGARFIGVFQAVMHLHQRVPAHAFAPLVPTYARTDFRRFHGAVTRALTPPVEYLDYSGLFDPLYDSVPVVDRRAADVGDEIFFDAVHLTDLGNRRVAEALVRYLRRR